MSPKHSETDGVNWADYPMPSLGFIAIAMNPSASQACLRTSKSLPKARGSRAEIARRWIPGGGPFEREGAATGDYQRVKC